MEITLQTTEHETSTGMMEAFMTATILLIGGFLTLPLFNLSSGHASRAFLVVQFFSAQELYWIGIMLWVLEVGLYGLICWSLSRQLTITVKGIALGFVFRLLVCLIMASLLSSHYSYLDLITFADMRNGLLLLRLLAIATSSLTLLLPCRGMIETGFGTKLPKSGLRPGARASNFSFRATPEQVPINIPDRPILQVVDAQNHVAPSDDFIPIPAHEGISGVVNIPASLVLESIPELETFLNRNYHIRVRLALIVPQLNRATVWLTWQQVFGEGVNDISFKEGVMPFSDSKFTGRWIRIPAKYYVPQMPGEFFQQTIAPVTPNWMKLTPVPQEDQFRGQNNVID